MVGRRRRALVLHLALLCCCLAIPQAYCTEVCQAEDVPLLPVVPVVDFSDKDTAKIAQSLSDAISTSGFFVAVGLPEESLQAIKTIRRLLYDGSVFGIAAETKERLSMNRVAQLFQEDVQVSTVEELLGNGVNASLSNLETVVGGRGFIPMGGESGQADLLEFKESFSYGMHGNVFPSDFPVDGLMQVFAGMVSASRVITRALSLAMYADETYLAELCKEGDALSLMRLFHYFPAQAYRPRQERAAPPELIGSSPHTDWGFLTLVVQDIHTNGLHACVRKAYAFADGETHQVTQQDGLYFDAEHECFWREVPAVMTTDAIRTNRQPAQFSQAELETSLLINVGDYLAVFSAGKAISPLHRVPLHSERERFSSVFFFYPSYDAKLKLSEGDDRYISLLDDQRENASDEDKAALLEKLSNLPFGAYIREKWNQVSRY